MDRAIELMNMVRTEAVDAELAKLLPTLETAELRFLIEMCQE